MRDAAMEERKKQAEIHRNCFRMSDEQAAKFQAWNEAHLKEKHPTPELQYCGAAGGRLSWTFTPTGLGQCLSVTCGLCGDKIDLSDYEDW